MKKASGSNQTATSRYGGGSSIYQGGHRHNNSASVGTSLKQRGSGAAEANNTTSERTGYH